MEQHCLLTDSPLHWFSSIGLWHSVYHDNTFRMLQNYAVQNLCECNHLNKTTLRIDLLHTEVKKSASFLIYNVHKIPLLWSEVIKPICYIKLNNKMYFFYDILATDFTTVNTWQIYVYIYHCHLMIIKNPQFGSYSLQWLCRNCTN